MQDNLKFLAGLDCAEHDHILSFANSLYQYFGIDQSHLFPTVFSYDRIHDTRNLASYEYFLDDVGLTDHEHALGVFLYERERI